MPKLGVNIDHVATLRQARREFDPSPVEAAVLVENAGADSIVVHLREDRRHINDNDVREIRKAIKGRLNLEMSLNAKIVKIAGSIRPDIATLVPEKREELTTEGGLDVVKHFSKIKKTTSYLKKQKIEVSLFIDPVKKQILKAKDTGATSIEIHTGKFDGAKTQNQQDKELKKIIAAVDYARKLGLHVSAGHGLKYTNTRLIAEIPGIEELNIGHSIICRALFIGLGPAVKEMLHLVNV